MNGSTRRRDMMGRVLMCFFVLFLVPILLLLINLARQQCRILSSSCLVRLQERFCTKYGILCISFLVVFIFLCDGGEEKGSRVSVRGASKP
jgi:hypothetical protein